MYVGLGATPQPLTTAQQAQISRALPLLPPCYSQAFDQCYEYEKLEAFPNCKAILDAYYLERDQGTVDKAVNKLPYCPVPKGMIPAGVVGVSWPGLLSAGLIGAAVGVAIGMRLK